MRILFIGNAGDYRTPGRHYYNVDRKIASGFMRNGHHVVFFSDRDVARAASWFRSSRSGRGAVNAKFLQAVRDYRPALIAFMHSNLITTETLALAKETGARLAQICVDPLFRPVNVAFLKDRARVTDASFVTTAGSVLKRFSSACNVSAFIPNPIDATVEDLQNFTREDCDIDVFFAANASKDREEDVRRITPRLMRAEPSLRCAFYGFDGAETLYGAAYFATLARASMGLNLSSDRAETALEQAPAEELYLYSSDRISQLLGCGLLTLSLTTNRLEELYGDGMIFADTPQALCEAAKRLAREDATRRRVAQVGWQRAHQEFNERRIAAFIIETTFRQKASQDYAWPTTLW